MDVILHLIGWVAQQPPALVYLVVLVWLIFESAGAPIPNEAILLFVGYLTVIGRVQAPLAWAAATLGSLGGATLSWWIARRFGRAGVRKIGRYLLLDEGRLAAAEGWFRRWGPHTILLARLTPVVRTVISYPAGLADMRYVPLAAATVVGAGIWCALMLAIGRFVGQHWVDLFLRYHTPALVLGLAVIVAVVGFLAFEHVLKRRLSQV